MIRTIPLTITLRAPYTVRGNLVGHFGIDAPLFRTASGKLAIPGTLVIGKLAEAFRHIAELGGDTAAAYKSDCEALFAAGSQKVKTNSDSDPKRADDEKNADALTDGREARRKVTASDFVCEEVGDAEVRTRIAIDNLSGTVAEGMLQVLEQAKKPKDTITFKGQLRLSGKHDADVEKRILKAAQWITQIGGLRTVGYGEVVSIKRADVETVETVKGTFPADGPVGLRLRFRDVFCVGEKRTASNIYTSSTVISGAAIKGALAQQILAHFGKTGSLADNADTLEGPFKTLARRYSDIRFRHAFPVKQDTKIARNGPLPLSLAYADKTLVDRAGPRFDGRPVLIDGDAPKPMDDWKNDQREAAKKAWKIEEPPKEFRMRTQIDPSTRAAMESRLFAIEYCRNDTHEFVMAIDLPDGLDRVVAEQAIRQAVAHGLAGIGRGGACCDVAFCALLEAATSGHVVMLKTPAMLRCPDPGQFPDLHTLYEAAFNAIGLAGTGFRLKTLYVDEELAGHAFMQMRRHEDNRDFMPFLLTKAGSVFVFEHDDPDAKLPKSWFKAGLPIPETVLVFHGLDAEEALWKVCPYVPENGYGEIEVHNPAAFDGEIEIIEPFNWEAAE